MGISVEVRNLGPLASAQIDLAGLNVLVGENNAGKSFFATVLHRVAASAYVSNARRRFDIGNIPDQLSDFVAQMLALTSEDEQSDIASEFQPDEVTIQWLESIAVDLLTSLGSAIRQGLAGAYSILPSALRRITPHGVAPASYLRVSSEGDSEDLSWSLRIAFDGHDENDDDEDDGDGVNIDGIEVEPPDPVAWLRYMLSGEYLAFVWRFLPAERIGMTPEPEDITNAFLRLLLLVGRPKLTQHMPVEAMHLPAERNGIMQNGRVLLSAALPHLADGPRQKSRSPHLTRTTTDMLNLMVSAGFSASRDSSTFGFPQLVADFERELGASIELDDEGQDFPTVVAVTPEGRFPLARTSAMLSELAPLLLITKHRLGEYDCLTIDEPEAHLHPEMQRRVASFLVQLADAGVTMVMATHSNFFVGQLNNHIRAHALAQMHSQPECSPTPEIDPSRVRALWFSRGDDGCIAESISVDRVDGISQAVFTDAMRKLHVETAGTINPLLEAPVD